MITLMLSALALAGDKPPDVFILIAEVSVGTPALPEIRPTPQALAVYQPGLLAMPLSNQVVLRPHVSVLAAPWGATVGIGTQLVWVRPRPRK